ncbi:MAG: zinc ribbon domain-containing protein [Rhizomicrobium sp.]
MGNSDAAINCPACKVENKAGARFCRQCGAQIAASAPGYDRAKWQALVQYDSDISSAADTVRSFGQMWVDELGASYMALNDKSYLPGIVEKVTARAKAEKQRQADIRAASVEKVRQEKQRQAEIEAAAAESAREQELERLRRAEQRRERVKKAFFFFCGTRNRTIATASVVVLAVMGVIVIALWPKPRPSYSPWTSECVGACTLQREALKSGVLYSRISVAPNLRYGPAIYVTMGRMFVNIDVRSLTLDTDAKEMLAPAFCKECADDVDCSKICEWSPSNLFLQKMRAANSIMVHGVDNIGRNAEVEIPLGELDAKIRNLHGS